MDFYGNDVVLLSTSNALSCQIECKKNTKCQVWTYNTASGGNGLNCWLKSKQEFTTYDSDRVSGPRICGKYILNMLTK